MITAMLVNNGNPSLSPTVFTPRRVIFVVAELLIGDHWKWITYHAMLAITYLRGYYPGLLNFGPYAKFSPGCLNFLRSSMEIGEGLGVPAGNGNNGIADKSRVIPHALLWRCLACYSLFAFGLKVQALSWGQGPAGPQIKLWFPSLPQGPKHEPIT